MSSCSCWPPWSRVRDKGTVTEPWGLRDAEGREAQAPPWSSAGRLRGRPSGPRTPLPVVAQRPQVHVDRGGVRAGRALEGEQQRSLTLAQRGRREGAGAPGPATLRASWPGSIGETAATRNEHADGTTPRLGAGWPRPPRHGEDPAVRSGLASHRATSRRQRLRQVSQGDVLASLLTLDVGPE